MSGRPWLEALKAAVQERGAEADEIPERIPEALPSEGCERCESPADMPPPVVEMHTAEKVHHSWGEEERRLIVAGWESKERCGQIIWKRPDNGFYVSQEMALQLFQNGGAA